MNEPRFEQDVRETARQYAYPPTPDIAGKVRSKLQMERRRDTRWLRTAAAVVAAVLLAGALWSVPAVRAAILDMLRIGAVTVIVGEETPTPDDRVYESALELPGETTLDDAQRRIGNALRLPDGFGAPDRVYMQEATMPVVTLVWLEAGRENEVRLALQIVNSRGSAFKYEPHETVEIEVNGRRALWLDTPHRLVFFGQDGEITRQVAMNVLVWEVGSYTYRLETRLPMDEAVRIAESMA